MTSPASRLKETISGWKTDYLYFLQNPECCGPKLKHKHKRRKMYLNNCLFSVIIWCSIFSFHATFAYSASINVSLGFIAPLDDSYGPLKSLGKELESAFKLAVLSVNQIETSPVKLRTDFKDIIVNEGAGNACKSAAAKFHGDQNIVGVIGAYSSACSIMMQKEFVNKGSKMPHISYRSQSLKLLDRTSFPTFFRTSSNNKKEAQVIVDIIKTFRWSQAGIIHSNDEYYGKELSDEIVSKSKNSEIYIRERKSFSSTDSDIVIEEKLQAIKASGSRINIIVAQGNDFFKIIRQIKKKSMYGEGWVWIATDGGTSLYVGEDEDVNITTEGFIGVAPEVFSGSTSVDVFIAWFGTQDSIAYPGKIWRSDAEPSMSPYVGQVFRAVSAYHSVLTQLANENKLSMKTPVTQIREMVTNRLKTLKDLKTSVKSMVGEGIFFRNGVEEEAKFTVMNQVKSEFEEVGSWYEKNVPALDLTVGGISWPGGSSQTPTDKGKPGKALFRIAFVSPTDAALDVLGDYGKELLSAFKLALEIINNDDNYRVELNGLAQDEGFDGNASCEKIAQDMKELNLVAVVGAYRSQCTMRLHDVLGSASVQMPIISYASPSSKLSDKTKYKYLFRIPPSNQYQSEIMRLIVRKFGFKQVAILYSDEISSKEIAKGFEECMNNDTIPIIKSQQFPANSDSVTLANHVEKIRQSGARVIFVSALPNDAMKIEQIAQQKEMTGKGWIWLGSDGATTHNLPAASKLAKAMDGMVGVNPRRGEAASYVKLLQLWKNKDRLEFPGIVYEANVKNPLPYTAQIFDAVNGIALALSDLISRQTINRRTNSLAVRSHLYTKLEAYNSESNGYISALDTDRKMFFDKNKDGPKIYDVVNLVANPNAEWRIIAQYEVVGAQQSMQYLKDALFPGGELVPVVGAGKIIYKVAAFFPKDSRLGALSDLGKIWESAFTAAVQWVNKNDSLTVGFDVTYIDSGHYASNCTAFAKNLPSYIDIVVGAARSECTVHIYQEIRNRNIPLLTYASTSSLLSDKTSYPNLFRLCPSDDHQAAAIADFVENYNWEKVGVVAAKGIYGEELLSDIEDKLRIAAIDVTASELYNRGSKRMTKQMANLKASGSGVNIMISNPQDALQLYQEAYELGMTGEGWTWIGSDGAISTMFKRSQNLQGAMDGMVGFRPKSGSGLLFESIYDEWLRVDHSTADGQVSYVAQVFDSILVPAFALHKLHKEKVITPQVSKIDARTSLLIELKSVRSTRIGYPSTTGDSIHFDVKQNVAPKYQLLNLNGNNWVQVGKYEDKQLDLSSMVVWPGGRVKIPPSNPPVEQPDNSAVKETSGTSQGLIVLAVVFSVFGILVIVFMLYIVRRVRYRHLYMQSDLNQGGVFSVLYGHTVNRPGAGTGTRTLMTNGGNSIKRHSLEAAIELSDPMMPRHL